MAPMEPNGYTTTFNRLIKEMLADQPQDFLEKTSFGKGLTEEDRRRREQREQERAEREAEKRAEKEAANPTNKTTRYGGVIYFVFLDNYLKDAEKKQVVKNANDILKANQIPAKVVGIQHPQNVKAPGTNSWSVRNFEVKVNGISREFSEVVSNSNYRAVFLAENSTFENPFDWTTVDAYGVTHSEASRVRLDMYTKEVAPNGIKCYKNNFPTGSLEVPELTIKYDKFILTLSSYW